MPPTGHRKDQPCPLAVPADLLDQARRGDVDDAADNQVPPPDEAARGQLLRLMASDALRAAAERHFRVRIAFQNCHRAAVFRPAATQALAEFTTARAQILNQSPELINC